MDSFPPDLPTHDMHVHSTFSDGRNSVEENVEEAAALGLTELTCVDHVRRTTEWLPDYVAEVRRVQELTDIRLRVGIEAKILDTNGILDMPIDLQGVDRIYAADHQVALADGPHNPREVKSAIERGEMDAGEVVAAIVESTVNAVREYADAEATVVIAHLFSVLPKIGVEEEAVPLELIEGLADAAAGAGALVEVDERWSCPSVRTLLPFVERGMDVMLSTDSHRRETIGRYGYVAEVWRALRRLA